MEFGVSSLTVAAILRRHEIVRLPFTLKERKQHSAERHKRRYREDPEFRRRVLAVSKRWQEEHRDRYLAYQREYGRKKRTCHEATERS